MTFEQTLAVRDRCLCLHAQRAARLLGRRFDQALKPHRLTNQQFSLLNALNRPKPPTVGALAAFLAMDRTSLTAALKPLERRRLVRSAPSPADARSRLLVLTPAGNKLLAKAWPVWKREHDALDADVGAPRVASLRKLLSHLPGTGAGR